MTQPSITQVAAPVTRTEIAALIGSTFGDGALSRNAIIAAAEDGGARPDVATLLERLPRTSATSGTTSVRWPLTYELLAHSLPHVCSALEIQAGRTFRWGPVRVAAHGQLTEGDSMAKEATGTRDEHYNLVSVLYHTLQEADTIQRYVDDARQAGDDDLVRFFQEVQEQDRQRAERAKSLLGERIPAMAR